jgi:hypothetical protein
MRSSINWRVVLGMHCGWSGDRVHPVGGRQWPPLLHGQQWGESKGLMMKIVSMCPQGSAMTMRSALLDMAGISPT